MSKIVEKLLCGKPATNCYRPDSGRHSTSKHERYNGSLDVSVPVTSFLGLSGGGMGNKKLCSGGKKFTQFEERKIIVENYVKYYHSL